MNTPRALPVLCLSVILALAGPASAADPGTVIPPSAEASDQKRGSILVYNLYTSGPDGQDTRLTFTNGHDSTPAKLRLFLVDGPTRSVTSSALCLGPNQTTSLNASSLRSGSTGYLVAVAVDGAGCPIGHNFLSGQGHVRFPSGFRGSLEAVGIALAGAAPACGGTANLALNGVTYNLVSGVLALSSFGSREDDSVTLLAVNRVGGDLSAGTSPVGFMEGLLYDDTESYSIYTFESDAAQVLAELSDGFPVIAPPLTEFVRSGRSGWTKLFNPTGAAGFLGAAFLFRSAGVDKFPVEHPATAGRSAVLAERAVAEFAGAVNLHALTLGIASYTMPVAPPGC